MNLGPATLGIGCLILLTVVGVIVMPPPHQSVRNRTWANLGAGNPRIPLCHPLVPVSELAGDHVQSRCVVEADRVGDHAGWLHISMPCATGELGEYG